MQDRRTRYSENMTIAVFSGMNLNLPQSNKNFKET